MASAVKSTKIKEKSTREDTAPFDSEAIPFAELSMYTMADMRKGRAGEGLPHLLEVWSRQTRGLPTVHHCGETQLTFPMLLCSHTPALPLDSISPEQQQKL